MLKRMATCAGVLMVLGGTAYAAIPNTTDYLHRNTPMISGTVFTVDDRQIVVDTDQGQQVTMVMDSRTMLPADLAPGMVMRAEFRVMENGQYYVSRVTPIRGAKVRRGVQASSDLGGQTQRSDRFGSAYPAQSGQTAAAEPATAVEPRMSTSPVAMNEAADNAARVGERPETLPQTAGNQALILLLGVLALSGAGALMLVRRLSHA